MPVLPKTIPGRFIGRVDVPDVHKQDAFGRSCGGDPAHEDVSRECRWRSRIDDALLRSSATLRVRMNRIPGVSDLRATGVALPRRQTDLRPGGKAKCQIHPEGHNYTQKGTIELPTGTTGASGKTDDFTASYRGRRGGRWMPSFFMR